MKADEHSTRASSDSQSSPEQDGQGNQQGNQRSKARHAQSLLSIGEVSARYGLSISAIRRYVNSGRLKAYLLPSNHRRFKVADVESFLGIEHEQSSKVLIYARVSSNKQSQGFASGSEDNDLARQIERLKKAAEEYGSPVVYFDTGSGLSFTRKGFTRMLENILAHKHDGGTLLLTHKDRLARFGSEIVEQVCSAHDIRVIYTEKESTTDEQELADDLISIITHFSARTYGRRAAKANAKELEPQTIRRAKELYDAGLPLWNIRDILKEEGHKDSKGTSPSYYVLKRHIVNNEFLEIAIPKKATSNSFEEFHRKHIEQADEKARLTKKDLYAAYVQFCKDNEQIALSAQQVGRLLKGQYGYSRKFTSTGNVAYVGIALKDVV